MSVSKIETEKKIEGVLHVGLRCSIAYNDKTTFKGKAINNVLLYFPFSWLRVCVITNESMDTNQGLNIVTRPLIASYNDVMGMLSLPYMPTVLLRTNVDYGTARTKSILNAACRKANISEHGKYVTMNVTGISEIPNRAYPTWHKACVKEIMAGMRDFAEKAAQRRIKDDQIKQSYLDKIDSLLKLK
jgi:hypothetical protein